MLQCGFQAFVKALTVSLIHFFLVQLHVSTAWCFLNNKNLKRKEGIFIWMLCTYTHRVDMAPSLSSHSAGPRWEMLVIPSSGCLSWDECGCTRMWGSQPLLDHELIGEEPPLFLTRWNVRRGPPHSNGGSRSHIQSPSFLSETTFFHETPSEEGSCW